MYRVGVLTGSTAISLNPSANIKIKFLPLNIPVYSFLFVGIVLLKYSFSFWILLFDVSLLKSNSKELNPSSSSINSAGSSYSGSPAIVNSCS